VPPEKFKCAAPDSEIFRVLWCRISRIEAILAPAHTRATGDYAHRLRMSAMLAERREAGGAGGPRVAAPRDATPLGARALRSRAQSRAAMHGGLGASFALAL
jgi:hypothetical protein